MNEIANKSSGQIMSRQTMIKIVSIFILLVVPSIWITSYWTTKKYVDQVATHAEQKMGIYLTYLNSELNKFSLLTSILAYDNVVFQFYQNKNDGINKYLYKYNAIIGAELTYLLDTNGTTLGSSNFSDKDSLLGESFTFRPYFQAALKGRPSQYLAIGTMSKVPGYYVSSPVFNQSGNVIGVAVIKFGLSAFEPIWYTEKERLMVLDQNDVIFISNVNHYKFQSMSPVDEKKRLRFEVSKQYDGREITPFLMSSDDSLFNVRIISTNENGKKYTFLMQEKKLEHFPWTVGVLLDFSERNIRVITNSSIAFLTVLVLTILAFAIIQRRNFLNEMYRRATIDPLTGLYTRLYMMEKVNELMASHDENKFNHLSIILFDIDFFKKVNDTYGHNIGDLVLKTVGEVILKIAGVKHLAVRYGGEEMLVIIKGDENEALNLAESIRKEVEQLRFDFNTQFVVTLSAGVTERQKKELLQNFTERADRHLYHSKKNGRNQVQPNKNRLVILKSAA